MSNFGSTFKKGRESKGISLDRIAAETRISTRFLLAIENEEFNLLPGGIFNRGFVRTYAEKVVLDPDQAVADYERLVAVREPAETATPAPTNRKGDRHLYPVVIGVLLLIIVIFYVVNREAPNTAQTANPAVANTPASPAEPAPASPTPSILVRRAQDRRQHSGIVLHFRSRSAKPGRAQHKGGGAQAR